MNVWSNVAKVVYKRTYARITEKGKENWVDTVNRVVEGNVGKFRGTPALEKGEEAALRNILLSRKAMPAGRGLWFSGTDIHKKIGGNGLTNCFFIAADSLKSFVNAQDLLMLGGGIGFGVQERNIRKLPSPIKGVKIKHIKGFADFYVQDSREGWCALLEKVLHSLFVTGDDFTYNTALVRKKGEPIKGFGGVASGPEPLVALVEDICAIVENAGHRLSSLDVTDIICAIGAMVVSGNVRRSALIIIGDIFDQDYLKAKRWDLGKIPRQRANANFSVEVHNDSIFCDAFWETFENGEPMGIVNLENIQKYARIGDPKLDPAEGVNPCAEICLESNEPCNLVELFLPNLDSEEEFFEVARLMYRWAKRVTCEDYHIPEVDAVVKKNRRVGVGITGCLQSPLFNPETLDKAYEVIKEEDAYYSKVLQVPESIRLTTVKPSGTVSLVGETTSGIHPAYSKYFIKAMRFASNDPLVEVLRKAGHPIEPLRRMDGSTDHDTVVVNFYCKAPEGTPCADDGFTTEKQLQALLDAQKHWADNSVSTTAYYERDNLGFVKDWIKENLQNIKTVSFLCHSDHGFDQAPLQKISAEEYYRMSSAIEDVRFEEIEGEELVDSGECEGGACPIR